MVKLNTIYSGDIAMAKTVTIRLDDRIYSLFRKLAEEENRTLSNFIETAALRSIQESESVDEFEMAEIRDDRTLNQSLKRGLADAKHKRGRLIE
jgi:predicted transcriptional regulator